MADTTQMTVRRDEAIPKALLRGMIILVAFVLALVFYASLTDRPLEAQPPDGDILSEKIVRLQGTVTGAARISDEHGAVIAEYAAGEGGFVSTIERVIRRERLRNGVQDDGVLYIRLREGNRMSVFDPSTGREIELEAFGRDNVAKFASIVQ
ncbi:MAG: photosynthetic complex assembly protein PuhC [Pseudomonadota bacterium]